MPDQNTMPSPPTQAPLDTYLGADGQPVPVKRFPTELAITCPRCDHRGVATIFLSDVSKLKCSKCGCAAPIVAGREPLRSWATRRRKGNANAHAPVGTRPRTKRGR